MSLARLASLALVLAGLVSTSGCGGSTPAGTVSTNGAMHTCAYACDPPVLGNVVIFCMHLCPSGTAAECPSLGRAPVPVTVIDPTAPPGTAPGATNISPMPARCDCSGGPFGSPTRSVSNYTPGGIVLK